MSYPDKRKQVDLLQQQINSHGDLSVELKKKINYKFRLDWNYYSNSMEGNTLTMDETRSVMVGNLTVGGKPIKDVLEMKGHDEVITEILKIGKGEVRLSETRIKTIHKGIMHEEDEAKKKKIGVWKTEPNYIFNYKNERFDFVEPAEVAERMHKLLEKTNAAIDAVRQNKKDAPHPLDIALEFHLEYVAIHPFYDGNGRTARILTNLLLISFGYLPFWIKTDERSIYYQYLGDIQGYGGKPDLFFEFVSGTLLRSQQLVLDAIACKEIEEPNDLDKRVALFNNRLGRKNEEIKKVKNDAVLKEMLLNLVEPLFKKIIGKVLKIAPLFADTELTYYLNDYSQSGSNPEHLIENLQNEWEKYYEVTNVDLNINLIKLKKLGKKTFSIDSKIEIVLNRYDYQILFKNVEIYERPYHILLTENQIEEIANNFANEIFNRMEDTYNALKNK